MTWLPLLLADPSACLRVRVLRELLDRHDSDPEVMELLPLREQDDLVVDLLGRQDTDGAWGSISPPTTGDRLRYTILTLDRLGHLGFGEAFDPVARGAEWLFSQQRDDGSWAVGRVSTESEGYNMIPLQTALPLRSLARCGYARDPRCMRAYEWLLDCRLADGAWPTGIAGGGVYGYVAGYRRIAHSRWGCRSNTTGALSCFALHPELCSGDAARRALDLLLGRETREAQHVGFETARLVGAEQARGFFTFFARFDAAQMLDLCWRVAASLDDARVNDLTAFVQGLCGPHGLWTYGERPQASRWVTLNILLSLSRLDPTSHWVSSEPQTPFSPYPRRKRRY